MNPRFAPVLFGFFLSAIMTGVISLVVTVSNVGATPGFAGFWLPAWAKSWAVAFPTVLFVAPAVRRFVGLLVRKPS